MEKKKKLALSDLRVTSFVIKEAGVHGGVAQPGGTSVYEPSITCECSAGSGGCCNSGLATDWCETGWGVCWL
jgi:hypothetical protein